MNRTLVKTNFNIYSWPYTKLKTIYICQLRTLLDVTVSEYNSNNVLCEVIINLLA